MQLSKRKVIGGGAYSIVYKCKDKKTGKYHAVKRLLVSKISSFCGSIREIDIVMSVQHPFVVKCYGLVDNDQSICSPVSRPYRDDGFLQVYDLYTHCLRGNESKVKSKLDFAFKILLAIEFIHGRGIVHRDLKPENILIDQENNPRIGDFGLAQRVQISGDDTYQTLCYRSPELLFGCSSSTFDSRSTDIWAYGCILYELLKDGKFLFGGSKISGGEAELVLHMSRHSLISNDLLTMLRERGSKKYPLSMPTEKPSSSLSEEDEIVKYILNPDPTLRPTASEVLRHPFFNSVNKTVSSNRIRTDYPIFPITMDTLDIRAGSKTRMAACNILIDIANKKHSTSWFKYVILFHTLEIIDRIISSNKIVKVGTVQNLVLSLTYILVKFFNEDQVSNPPSFKNFYNTIFPCDPVPDEIICSKNEYHLLHDILDYEVFRMTPYEYHVNIKTTIPYPDDWDELSLLFMMYTRMTSGCYHISDVWNRAKEVGKRLSTDAAEHQVADIVNQVNKDFNRSSSDLINAS